MSEKNWTNVYSSSDPFKIEIVKGMLEDEGIHSFVINKKDSAYLFGEVELYVEVENAFQANQLIKKVNEQ